METFNRICVNDGTEILVDGKKVQVAVVEILRRPRHNTIELIGVSNTEKIEVNDYWINTKDDSLGIRVANETDIERIARLNAIHCKKILVTPKKFSPTQIKDYVSGKFTKEMRILIEFEEYAYVKPETGWIYKGETLKVESVYIEKNHLHPERGRNLRLSLEGTHFTSRNTVIWEKDLILKKYIKLDQEGHVVIHSSPSEYLEKYSTKQVISILEHYTTDFKNDKISPNTISQWFDKHYINK